MMVALLAFISRATALTEAPSASRCNVSSRCYRIARGADRTSKASLSPAKLCFVGQLYRRADALIADAALTS